MSKLVLASASPRRAGLLGMAGVAFDVCPADIDETRRPGEGPLAYVARMAREKALVRPHPGRPVLAADTMVYIGDRIFGKPRDDGEAARHLRQLGGRTHHVATAFCLALDGRPLREGLVTSDVTFRRLTPGEIEAYVATGEGRDKAGAYGLQGLGGFLIEEIRGSHTNVIGLPLTEVLAALDRGAPAVL